jgi:hypothetical protein
MTQTMTETIGKFLSDVQYDFTLEPYADGTPGPTVVTKEVDMTVTFPFLLVKSDFSKTEVVLETDNRSQERGSAEANEDSVYFQPDVCLGQQDLGV